MGSPASPGLGDASTCPAAPLPPVTFPAKVAEAAAAAAAQHNRARPPRLGRLLMARSAPPFIHSVSRQVSHLLLPALGPGKPPQPPPPPPPGSSSPPPSDRRPAPRAGPSAEGATRPSADSPPSPIGSLTRPMGGHAIPRDPAAPQPLCSLTDQSEGVKGRGWCRGWRRVVRSPLQRIRLAAARLCLPKERGAGLRHRAPGSRQRTRPARQAPGQVVCSTGRQARPGAGNRLSGASPPS